MVQMTYGKLCVVPPHKVNNVFMADIPTAPYNYLERLQDRILYYDMDSLGYLTKEG